MLGEGRGVPMLEKESTAWVTTTGVVSDRCHISVCGDREPRDLMGGEGGGGEGCQPKVKTKSEYVLSLCIEELQLSLSPPASSAPTSFTRASLSGRLRRGTRSSSTPSFPWNTLGPREISNMGIAPLLGHSYISGKCCRRLTRIWSIPGIYGGRVNRSWCMPGV